MALSKNFLTRMSWIVTVAPGVTAQQTIHPVRWGIDICPPSLIGLSYILLLFVLHRVEVRRIPFMEGAGVWQLVPALPCRVKVPYVCLTSYNLVLQCLRCVLRLTILFYSALDVSYVLQLCLTIIPLLSTIKPVIYLDLPFLAVGSGASQFCKYIKWKVDH
jgi:hypothetical protein